MNPQPQIQLLIHSNPLFLSGARELVYHVASRVGFSDEACGQMALAVDEAICNVIRHGYNRAPDKPIWISMFLADGAVGPGAPEKCPCPAETLTIVIEDEARQVDLSSIKSRDLDEIRPGGLGVHIIQEVMDEVRYEHRGTVGMRLTMVKRRSSSKVSPGGREQGSAA